MGTSDFYDAYVNYQVKSGINDRIYSLYKRLLKLGLSPNEQVLEIGCGIGALTFLLAGKIRKGYIEAFDPSAKSVDFAKKKIQQANVHLSTGDVLTYTPQIPLFDKVILFDVLEHIPIKSHSEIFRKIHSWIKDDGLLLINIPNPEYILYDQLHQPGELQETDQPVLLNELLPKLISSGLELKHFETYGVWVREDYQFIIVRKRQAFTEQLLNNDRSLFTRGIFWLKRKYRQFRYSFP